MWKSSSLLLLQDATFLNERMLTTLYPLPSPGEVPETGEALLNAFKRLDNDLSLEAQVGVLAGLLVASLPSGFFLWRPG